MTKKDYIIITNAFNYALKDLSERDVLNPVENMPADKAMYIAVTCLAQHISKAMTYDNENFDRMRFLKSLEITKSLG